MFEKSEKFRAEIFRNWGFLAGAPLGAFIMHAYLIGYEINTYFFIRLFIALVSAIASVSIIKYSHSIMYDEDIREKRREKWTK